LRAGQIGEGGQVLVLDMGDPVRILDLANEVIRLSGFEPDKDIPIVFTGPRPGEKITEELLTKKESIIATHDRNIFVAKLSSIEEQKVILALDSLALAARTQNKEKITNVLKEAIRSLA
jgi:FlaA1/EpsC-like NDP-sugar epimerase